jgi:hypothetical protein
MFVERPEIKGEFSSDVVAWVADDSRETGSGTAMKIDLVEKEVLEFKNRMELDGEGAVNWEKEPERTSGWRKWQGEWTPRPIGVL